MNETAGISPPPLEHTAPAAPGSPVYDVANDSVRLDGSIAFDNPAYATHKDVNKMRKVK